MSIFRLFELLVFLFSCFQNVNFSTFWTSCFHILERRFFVLEYRKRYFPGLHCLKKNIGKFAIFGPKPWVNRFGKMSIFLPFDLLNYSLERRFLVSEYRKRTFPGLYYLKEKVVKMAVFVPKPWFVNFSRFSTFCFLA